MLGGGEDVKYCAIRREQSVRTVDWSVAVSSDETMSMEI